MENEIKPNSFLSVLQRKELNDGLLTEASQKLGEAALAAKATGKKATVILTMIIEPQKRGALAISAAVGNKVPPTREESFSIFFVDKDGALHRDDPDQKEFELKAHQGGVQTSTEESTTEAVS
jgi:hypothetical protein